MEEAIKSVGAGLVIVDPIMAYLPADVNAHRDQDVRRALSALKALAERTGAAAVVIRHLNKIPEREWPISRWRVHWHRCRGSRGPSCSQRTPTTRWARCECWQPRRRTSLLLPPALKLRLMAAPGDAAPRVSWDGESSHTAATLLAVPEPGRSSSTDDARSALEEASDFLGELLADGAMPALRVASEARAALVRRRPCVAPRRPLRARGQRGLGPGEEQRWDWVLRSSTVEHLEHLRATERRSPLLAADVTERAQDPEKCTAMRRFEHLQATHEAEPPSLRDDNEGAQGAQALSGTCRYCGRTPQLALRFRVHGVPSAGPANLCGASLVKAGPKMSQGPAHRLVELLAVEDVARILKLKPSTIRAYAERGSLPCVRVGNRLRFLPSDVGLWISRRYRKGGS